jgi:hypothetical protein
LASGISTSVTVRVNRNVDQYRRAVGIRNPTAMRAQRVCRRPSAISRRRGGTDDLRNAIDVEELATFPEDSRLQCLFIVRAPYGVIQDHLGLPREGCGGQAKAADLTEERGEEG